MDSSEHYVFGEFQTEEESVEACKCVVQSSIADVGAGLYTTMGDDPFIVATGGSVSRSGFSAWTYAKTLIAQAAADSRVG